MKAKYHKDCRAARVSRTLGFSLAGGTEQPQTVFSLPRLTSKRVKFA